MPFQINLGSWVGWMEPFSVSVFFCVIWNQVSSYLNWLREICKSVLLWSSIWHTILYIFWPTHVSYFKQKLKQCKIGKKVLEPSVNLVAIYQLKIIINVNFMNFNQVQKHIFLMLCLKLSVLNNIYILWKPLSARKNINQESNNTLESNVFYLVWLGRKKNDWNVIEDLSLLINISFPNRILHL